MLRCFSIVLQSLLLPSGSPAALRLASCPPARQLLQDEIGPLIILPKGGTMTVKRYISVLKEHFIPFYRRIRAKYGPLVVIQEDNALWHKAKTVRDFLTKQKVKILS